MHSFNVLSRRSFLDHSAKVGLGVALSTLTDIPFVMKRALAEGSIGLNGKKLLFIWLRGANDSINSLIPIQDSAYNGDLNPATGTVIRPNLAISKDGSTDYSVAIGGADFPQSSPTVGDPSFATYFYNNGINLRSG